MSKKPKFKLGPSKYPHVLRAVQSDAYIVPNTPFSLLPDPQNQVRFGIDFLPTRDPRQSWVMANGSRITEARTPFDPYRGNADQEINNSWIQEATHEPERAQKYHFITWPNILSYCDRIYQSIHQSGYNVDAIIAIPKGGFIPARILSEMFKEIPIYSYNQELPKQFFMQRKTCLIVDDICDSGATFEKIVNTRQPFSYLTCAIVMRAGSGMTPRFVGYVHSGSEWIVFPWERDGIYESMKK